MTRDKKTVLITGVNGMLGQNLTRVLAPDFHIIGVDLADNALLPQVENYSPLNLTDDAKLAAYLTSAKPDAVVHTAAYTNVDGAEDQEALARQINGAVPGRLAQHCHTIGAYLLHISTDYVFSGENGPYAEDDPCDPRGVYAMSKYEGESAVLASPLWRQSPPLQLQYESRKQKEPQMSF